MPRLGWVPSLELGLMAIDLTSAVKPMATLTVTTTGGTWDRVDLPSGGDRWVRAVEIVNRAGQDLFFSIPTQTDGGAWSAGDNQSVIADGASDVVALAVGRGRPILDQFSIRSATAGTVYLKLRQD